MNKEEKQELLRAVNEYLQDEFGESIQDISEDGILHLAYTTYDFGDGIERDIQVDFDPNSLKYLNYIDWELVLEEPRDCLSDFIDEIEGCGFDDMIRSVVHKGWAIYGSDE